MVGGMNIEQASTVRKEMNCCRETEILHVLVHETTRISSWPSDFREVS